jgi:molybdopterin synthase catalytic subunit
MDKKLKNIFVQGPISPEFIANSIAYHQKKTNIGGHSIFLGQVRADEKESGIVVAIDYTAYEDMALEKVHEIREETFSKYSLTCMHIYHSLGEVKTGEICIFVFTSSAHRKAAIDSCEELVERIKNEVPIWGRELIDSGESAWKVNS